MPAACASLCSVWSIAAEAISFVRSRFTTPSWVPAALSRLGRNLFGSWLRRRRREGMMVDHPKSSTAFWQVFLHASSAHTCEGRFANSPLSRAEAADFRQLMECNEFSSFFNQEVTSTRQVLLVKGLRRFRLPVVLNVRKGRLGPLGCVYQKARLATNNAKDRTNANTSWSCSSQTSCA